MSTKRAAAESSSPDELFQREDNAKHAKVDLPSKTRLQDLPMELLEYVLVKAVVLEVQDMKLAKSVWKEKADLVIRRLGAVSSQWSSILAANIFRNKVHKTIDGTSQMFHLEVLHQSPIQSFVFRVATIRDEMFMLCRPENQEPFINVHDRNNMVEAKHVIPLPGILPEDMAACSVSNCLYMLNWDLSDHRSILRITKDEELQFNISPWLNDLCLPSSYKCLFVVGNGSLIILTHQERSRPSAVSIYDPTGSLQHTITLFPAIHDFNFIFSVLQKSNGNLVLATINSKKNTDLMEIDMMGRIIRQYCSSIYGNSGVTVADACGRIMIACLGNNCDLLDAEFNLLDLTVPQQTDCRLQCPFGMHYNSERNEIVRLYTDGLSNPTKVLTIFRFTGE